MSNLNLVNTDQRSASISSEESAVSADAVPMSAEEMELFDKIPIDGESRGNKSLRQILKWDEEKYWRVRDELVRKGHIMAGKGQGGSVFRIKQVSSSGAVPPQGNDGQRSEYESERNLYKPFADSLIKWAKDQQFSNYFIEDGSNGFEWAQFHRFTGPMVQRDHRRLRDHRFSI